MTLPAIHLAIDRLSATCEYVLIDAPASFTERTLTALDASDLICLVTSASLPSLRATRACLDFFKKLGVEDDKVLLTLNDSTAHAMGSSRGRCPRPAPDFAIKRSEGLDRAANAGQPLVVSDPATRWSPTSESWPTCWLHPRCAQRAGAR